jgi:hypothetical protein
VVSVKVVAGTAGLTAFDAAEEVLVPTPLVAVTVQV